MWIVQRSASLCACLCMTVVEGGHLLQQHTACSDSQMSSQQVAAVCVQVPVCGRVQWKMNLDRVNEQNMQARMIN